uniref:Fibrinogen C-terminal domain-containing protein n=2 Tax=Stomoxys calcitrans TaxID=35570 RepID=A0A1I8P1H5_STOCA
MKTTWEIKSLRMILLLVLGLIQGGNTTTTEDSCYAQEDDASIGHWFEQVTQNMLHMQEKMNNLELQMKQMMKVVDDKCSKDKDIVIQRRMDGSVDFYRTWSDYKVGFGNNSGELFIGLENIHKLTTSRPYQLLIILEDWEGDRRLALYDFFAVGSEDQQYPLLSLGSYSGNAGDSLSYHLGQKFSTKDRDNDDYKTNCAVDYTGAWWYKSCHYSNLNGRYLKYDVVGNAQGVDWYHFKQQHSSQKFVEMILRPR